MGHSVCVYHFSLQIYVQNIFQSNKYVVRCMQEWVWVFMYTVWLVIVIQFLPELGCLNKFQF